MNRYRIEVEDKSTGTTIVAAFISANSADEAAAIAPRHRMGFQELSGKFSPSVYSYFAYEMGQPGNAEASMCTI